MQSSDLSNAVRTYLNRRDRLSHPVGKFDKAGRWYPSEEETCECCKYIRTPSRAWPYSYMTHCRTIEHVAHLYNVDAKELRRAVRAQERQVAVA